MDTAGPFSAVSLKQLTAPQERQRRLQDPSLQVSEQLKTLEKRHGRPEWPRHLVLAVSSKQSDASFVHILQCFSRSA